MQTKSNPFNFPNIIYVLIEQSSGQLQRQHKYKKMTIKIQNNRKNEEEKNTG